MKKDQVCDFHLFHLFPQIKICLGENDFSQKTLDVGYFEGLQETHFHYDIQVLGHQLMKFIELKENYAEKQNIF